MTGFHAGEAVWAIYKEAPGQPYTASLLVIKEAILIDGKVKYRFSEIEKPVPASRVCATITQMSREKNRLNKMK